MGLFDSSRTRVAPVFDALFASDPTGRKWLSRLLALGSRSARLEGVGDLGVLPKEHPMWWGRNERVLSPPRALLRWLVSNASPPASPPSWGSDAVRRRRELLVHRDPTTIQEALQL